MRKLPITKRRAGARPIASCLAAALLAGALLPAAARGADDSAAPATRPPDSLEDFLILQYIAGGAYVPSAVIGMDNNARILFECREGRSAEQLRSSGIDFADSQMEFLIATQLMFRDGLGDLYTAFPILDSEVASKLRAETAGLADQLSVAVRPEAETLAQALEDSGLSDSGYSIFFSYVLDGMVWGFFEEYQKVPRRALSARRPFWAGEVWAIRPERESWAQTRSIAVGGLTLKVTSGPRVNDAHDLFADVRQLKEALAQFSNVDTAMEGPSRDLLARFDLVDDSGRWSAPVIDEVKKGAVFRAAESLTSNLVDALLETADLEGFRERYRFRSPQQALVVVYHELMWDLIDRFERMGLVTRPDSLQPAAQADGPQAPQAFLVDRRMPKPDRQDVIEPRRDSLEMPEARENPEPGDAG